ncbi:MAG TPA: hypothetical protein EYP73_04235 [Acidimicrobiia bacterium]|nr:hypothetical protein [Acidimicrobiia bacterium]
MVRRTSTSALTAIALWLVLALFGTLLAQLAADIISPVSAANPESAITNVETELVLSRLSPITLFEEASSALLNPEVRTLGLVTLAQLDGAIVSELTVAQSLLLVWAQVVGLVAATVVIFAAAYVAFLRQEVRA